LLPACSSGDLDGDGVGDVACISAEYDADYDICSYFVSVRFSIVDWMEAFRVALPSDNFPMDVDVGDVTGDRKDDLVIVAVESHLEVAMASEPTVSKVFVFAGPFGAEPLDDEDANVTIWSTDTSSGRGDIFSATLLDSNADGIEDILLGAPYGKSLLGDPLGAAYLFYGGSDFAAAPGSGDMATDAADVAFVGEAFFDTSDLSSRMDAMTGYFVASGDYDNDGYEDALIMSRYVENDGELMYSRFTLHPGRPDAGIRILGHADAESVLRLPADISIH
jgi:hypothetical protein